MKEMRPKETNISFYLKANRIHIFVDALRGIGSPRNICFLIEENGSTLALVPYPKKDLKSHRVPQSVYKGEKSMEVCSTRLCQILTAMFQWDSEHSYRVPGVILPQKELVLFYLTNAEVIERKE